MFSNLEGLTKTSVGAAITPLLAQPETADLGRELDAEHRRLRQQSTRFGLTLFGGLLAVALVAGIMYGIGNGAVTSLVSLIRGHALAAVVLAAVAIVALVQGRNLYLRHRLAKFLDARTEAGPHVALTRQTIAARPADMLVRGLTVAVPVALVAVGGVLSGLFALIAGLGLRIAPSGPKSM